MSATTMPGFKLERGNRFRGRLFLFALGPFQPAGATHAHHRRQHAAAHRMPALRVDQAGGRNHQHHNERRNTL